MPKSFKRKYKKLCERFDALIEESEELLQQIEKAKIITNRISLENTYLLDLLLYQDSISMSSSFSTDSESAIDSDIEMIKNQDDAGSDISSYYRDSTPPHFLSLSPYLDYFPLSPPENKIQNEEYENRSILSTNSLFLSKEHMESPRMITD
ncbi:hypothetical protein PCANB_003080 [Pneumocystis canis]|nr:hypothetical protein PCK1_003119 [Pneumocystis canis]KAG5438229.1 hypothetical protein PCANB_003080 [Pneumocystis canis]